MSAPLCRPLTEMDGFLTFRTLMNCNNAIIQHTEYLKSGRFTIHCVIEYGIYITDGFIEHLNIRSLRCLHVEQAVSMNLQNIFGALHGTGIRWNVLNISLSSVVFRGNVLDGLRDMQLRCVVAGGTVSMADSALTFAYVNRRWLRIESEDISS